MSFSGGAGMDLTNGFSVDILYDFRIENESSTYRYKVLNTSDKVDDCSKIFFSPTFPCLIKYEPLPPYILGIVSHLINRVELSTVFKFCLQYIGTDFCSDIPTKMTVSYDVVNAGGRQTQCATFEVLSEPAVTGFLTGVLLPTFNKARPEITNFTEIPLAWRSAGLIDHEVRIVGYDVVGTKVALKARSTVTFRRHPYGEYASALILPRFPDAEATKQNTVVLANYELCPKECSITKRALSTIVCQNLEALELGISAATPKIVFIQGEPGSGKDGFANAIHHGSAGEGGRPDKANARSIAGMDTEQFRREVFGEERDGILIEGLIDKAKGGTIFLDEFDKLHDSATGAYAELLRVWESGEYVPLNGRSVRTANKNVNWVVAGAFTSQRTATDLPPDLWSRFTAQIAIQNPISSSFVDDSERLNYIHSLIFNFMLFNGLAKTGEQKLRKQMDALRQPKSRYADVAGKLLFADGRGSDGKRLEPSNLMTSLASALTKYLGTYWVCTVRPKRLENNPIQPKAREYCFPKAIVAALDPPSNLQDFFPQNNPTPDWLAQFSEPLQLVGMVPQYDSVRAIRQSCQVVFSRFFELILQKSKKGDNITTCQVKKILNEAFTTIDLSRSGSGLEQLIKKVELDNYRFKDMETLLNIIVRDAAAL